MPAPCGEFCYSPDWVAVAPWISERSPSREGIDLRRHQLDGFLSRPDGTFDFLSAGSVEPAPHGFDEFLATNAAFVSRSATVSSKAATNDASMMPAMRKSFRAVVLLPFLVATALHAQTADERELRRLKEERWPRAYREGDVALLDSILAKEFRRIDDKGNWSSKQDELDYVAKHRPSYREFRFEIRRLEVFENGTAVVAGRGVITGDATNPNAVFEYQSSNVLIKRDARWQAISSHVSGVTAVETAASAAPPCPPPTLTRKELEALRESAFQVSSDDERNRIALLLPQCLGDPDPEMRDGIAFAALSAWLRASALAPSTIRTLAARLTPELRAPDDAAGFRKPFVVLVLSEVARADRISAVLDPAARQALVAGAVHYLQGVTDYRGFDARAGWRHGVAHGADLVLQLGLNAQVPADEVRRLLDALAGQVVPGAVSYAFGEPERFARAVYFIHRRDVLNDAFWDEWLTAFGTPPSQDTLRSAEGLARRHNAIAFLHAIAFAARSAGDEAGAKLATLTDREIRRLMGG